MADTRTDKTAPSIDAGLSSLFNTVWPALYRGLEWGHRYGLDVGAFFTGTIGLVAIGSYEAHRWYKAQHDLPSRSDTRERMANQLLARGHATVDELLEASFGEWPPKGLDIIGKNDQRVNLVQLFKMLDLDRKHPLDSFGKFYHEFRQIAGRASLVGERKIGINPFSNFSARIAGKSNTASIMGHETAHILQGDHYYRAADIFGKKNAQNLWTELKKPMSNMIVESIFTGDSLKPGVKIDPEKSADVRDKMSYYANGIEMQARIHQIVAQGYQQWKTMPGTAAEVMVALMEMGLKAPKSVTDWLEARPDYQSTKQKFASDKVRGDRNIRSAVYAINFTQDALTVKGVAKLWHVGLPSLYGDLVEMYGDRYGNERFMPTVNRYRIFREERIQATLAERETQKAWAVGPVTEDMRIVPRRPPEPGLTDRALTVFNAAVRSVGGLLGRAARRSQAGDEILPDNARWHEPSGP